MITIARYDEIALKGGNRIVFEKRLIANIIALGEDEKEKISSIKIRNARIIIQTINELKLERVFGVYDYSKGYECEREVEEIGDKILENIPKTAKTFCIRVHRNDKTFLTGSQEMEKRIGKYVQDKTGLGVRLKNPDLEAGVDIIQGKAYVFVGRAPCWGGLPVGSNGRAVGIIRNWKDELAALMVMKRGVRVLPLTFDGYECMIIKKYCPGIDVTEGEGVEVKRFVRRKKAVAVVGSFDIDKVNLEEENYEIIKLNPLIGMREEEMKKTYKAYEEMKPSMINIG